MMQPSSSRTVAKGLGFFCRRVGSAGVANVKCQGPNSPTSLNFLRMAARGLGLFYFVWLAGTSFFSPARLGAKTNALSEDQEPERQMQLNDLDKTLRQIDEGVNTGDELMRELLELNTEYIMDNQKIIDAYINVAENCDPYRCRSAGIEYLGRTGVPNRGKISEEQ